MSAVDYIITYALPVTILVGLARHDLVAFLKRYSDD